MPGAHHVRNDETYQRFYDYLVEVGLVDRMRGICLMRHVSLKDIYLDSRGPSHTAARLHAWWILFAIYKRSKSEIARLFDRDNTSILYGLKKLEDHAKRTGVVLTVETIGEAAIAVGSSFQDRMQAIGLDRKK